ncbi:Uncharacterised protein [Turicibacter sanguinis]|nr:Uncharacterised protein [Turicibacter sanguinis]
MLDGLMSDYPFLKMLDEEALAIIERNLVQKKGSSRGTIN